MSTHCEDTPTRSAEINTNVELLSDGSSAYPTKTSGDAIKSLGSSADCPDPNNVHAMETEETYLCSSHKSGYVNPDVKKQVNNWEETKKSDEYDEITQVQELDAASGTHIEADATLDETKSNMTENNGVRSPEFKQGELATGVSTEEEITGKPNSVLLDSYLEHPTPAPPDVPTTSSGNTVCLSHAANQDSRTESVIEDAFVAISEAEAQNSHLAISPETSDSPTKLCGALDLASATNDTDSIFHHSKVTADENASSLPDIKKSNVGPPSPAAGTQQNLDAERVSSTPEKYHCYSSLQNIDSAIPPDVVGVGSEGIMHHSSAIGSSCVDTGRAVTGNVCVDNLGEVIVEEGQDEPNADPSALGSRGTELSVDEQFLIDLPPLVEKRNHTVLVEAKTVCHPFDKIPVPCPNKAKPKFFKFSRDSNKYVILPYADEARWNKIRHALGSEFRKSCDIQVAIEEYSNSQSWMDFNGLHAYMNREDEQEGKYEELMKLVKQISKLALDIQDICPRSIPILQRDKDSSITLSQNQAACLLANAFFCTFPNSDKHNGCIHLSFAGLYRDPTYRRYEAQFAKLDCIFNYFRRVTKNMPCGTITFHRQVKFDELNWEKSTAKLQNLEVSPDGRLPDDALGCLHVDFANKCIGGGMLGEGCVQEEILFMLYPELIVSRLFTEMLAPNETVIITGCERFNDGTGYASTFRWACDHQDKSQRDSWGRRQFEIVAMDALELWGAGSDLQLTKKSLLRELNKAFCGFDANELQQCRRPTKVATGNWGCGAFGGNPYIKAVIQLMAASQAGRPVRFFTFDDDYFAEDLRSLHFALTSGHCTVGRIFHVLCGLECAYRYKPFASDGFQDIIDFCCNND